MLCIEAPGGVSWVECVRPHLPPRNNGQDPKSGFFSKDSLTEPIEMELGHGWNSAHYSLL